MKKVIGLNLLMALTAVAAAQTGKYCIENRFSEMAMFDSSQIVIQKNIVYSIPKKWPGSGVDTLKLDIYYPITTTDALAKRPAIVFFYGGAWITGSKNDAGIQQKCFEWARRGFVAIAPNYRLGWNCAASDLLGVCVLCQGNYYDLNTAVYRGAQDGKAAMRWVVNQSNSYKIDTSALFIGGESAGSFNALHTAFWNHNYAKKVFNGAAYKILGSIDSAGSNIGTTFSIKGIIDNCGAVVYDTALHLAKTPLVSFHDESDCVVPYQINRTLNCCATSFFYAKGSKELYTNLSSANVPAELHTVPGATPAHCSYPSLTLVKESSCFIKKILCGLSPNGSSNYPTTPAISCNSLKTNGLKLNASMNITIYPVPAKEVIYFRGEAVNKIKSIHIFNSTGKLIKTANLLGLLTDKNLLINDLNAGIYYLQMLMHDGKGYVQKIQVTE